MTEFAKKEVRSPIIYKENAERLHRIERLIKASFNSPFERALAHILMMRGASIPEGQHTFTEVGFQSLEELQSACHEVDRVLRALIVNSKKIINIVKHMLGKGIYKRKLEAEREHIQLNIEGLGAHEFAHAKKAVELGADVTKMMLGFTSLTDGGTNLDVSMQIYFGTEDHRIKALSALAPQKPSDSDFEIVRIILRNQDKYPLPEEDIAFLKAEYAEKSGRGQFTN